MWVGQLRGRHRNLHCDIVLFQADTWRNNNAIITSKRHNDVINSVMSAGVASMQFLIVQGNRAYECNGLTLMQNSDTPSINKFWWWFGNAAFFFFWIFMVGHRRKTRAREQPITLSVWERTRSTIPVTLMVQSGNTYLIISIQFVAPLICVCAMLHFRHCVTMAYHCIVPASISWIYYNSETCIKLPLNKCRASRQVVFHDR